MRIQVYTKPLYPDRQGRGSIVSIGGGVTLDMMLAVLRDGKKSAWRNHPEGHCEDVFRRAVVCGDGPPRFFRVWLETLSPRSYQATIVDVRRRMAKRPVEGISSQTLHEIGLRWFLSQLAPPVSSEGLQQEVLVLASQVFGFENRSWLLRFTPHEPLFIEIDDKATEKNLAPLGSEFCWLRARELDATLPSVSDDL